MRRLVCLLVVPVALATAHAAAAQTWAQAQIQYLLRHGVLPNVASPAAFHADRPLTPALLTRLVAAAPDAKPVPWLASASATLTIGELDNAFVTALGLRGVAADVARGLTAAGLQPPPGAGVEVTARELGLRPNLPAAQDDLERWSTDPATRADAAYSLWRVLTAPAWVVPDARTQLAGLALQPIPQAVLGPLQQAVAQIGAPYVWGGASPDDGGFDCSGLVVDAEGGATATWLGGRSTEEMAAAITPAEKVARADLQAGDLVFFGTQGPPTPPRGIFHVGLALGGVWFVHASVRGVTLDSLAEPYYAKQFAYGRRPPTASPPPAPPPPTAPLPS